MSGIVPSRLKRLPRLILEDWIAIRVLTNDTVHSRSYYPEHPTKPKLIIFRGALTRSAVTYGTGTAGLGTCLWKSRFTRGAVPGPRKGA